MPLATGEHHVAAAPSRALSRRARHAQNTNLPLPPAPHQANLPKAEAFLFLETTTKCCGLSAWDENDVLGGFPCKSSVGKVWPPGMLAPHDSCDARVCVGTGGHAAASAACSPAWKQKHLTGARVQAQQEPGSQPSSNPGSQ